VIDCLSSSPCLWTSIECAYCVAIMLICWNVFFNFMRGSLSIVSRFFIDGMCVVALAPATNTMSGATFHPLVIMLMMRWLVFCGFSIMDSCGKYVIAVCKFYELYGDFCRRGLRWGWLYGCPITHNMSGLNMAMQWHLWVPHVHGNSHVGTLFMSV
jgi:hypothetical protein